MNEQTALDILTSYAYDIGKACGWDTANFREAYGPDEAYPDETLEAEAGRRAFDAYSDPGLRSAYLGGFLDGAQFYAADQWQDGTPRVTDAWAAGTGIPD